MRRNLFVAIALALLVPFLVSCGGGDDAPTVSNEAPFVGEKFTLSGNVEAESARSVVLQAYDSGWAEVDTTKSSADGAYEFTTSLDESSRRFRIVAPAAGELERHVSDPVTVRTVEDEVHLSVVRADKDGVAIGESKYRKAGRMFELQWLDGSEWKKLGEGKEDGHGRVRIPFKLTGSKFYRLVGDVIRGTKGATSPATRFTKGPKKLSRNVMYVTVDDFKDPVIKGEDYEANAVMVTDGVATKPFRVDEFAVRGNSTARKIKHPYKVKFKKNRRPFGLPEDKTWILLANYGDRALIRTQIGYDVGAGLDGLTWTPRGTFTELYVNGDYKGSYQLSESIKIDKNRINISQERGIIVEIDKHYADDNIPGFFGDHKIPYAFKDPDQRKKLKDGSEDPEGITDDKIAGMKSRIMAFEEVLYGKDFKDPEDGWTKYLDLDSAVDYYLVKEFTKENDGDFYRSNFFYIPDYTDSSKKFQMGPVWDFDRSAGSKPAPEEGATSTVASPKGWWLRGNSSPNHSTSKTHWYVQITKDPVFIKALKKRWAEKRGFFKDMTDAGIDRNVDKVGVAARNDRLRWGPESPLRLPPRADTYAGEIAFMKNWYKQRFEWMDSKLR